MVGCDFLPSIPTVEVRKAHALLAKHGELQGAHVLLLLFFNVSSKIAI
jgi:hypothetical protein